MRCCVPSCKSASENITFYRFPTEVHQRTAWLKAIGQTESKLLHSSAVCSQHFLDEDICETESGSKDIVTNALPVTVQVCMMCLATESKMFSLSQHKLGEAYQMLSGHPAADLGNLRQTLCVQCAQRLRNFSRFRDKTLRTRALMADLVTKHDLITKQHITEMITEHQLKSDLVTRTLGPDHCDLRIEHSGIQTEIQDTRHCSVVKREEYEYSNSNNQFIIELDVTKPAVKTEESDDLMPVHDYKDFTKVNGFVHTVKCEKASLELKQFGEFSDEEDMGHKNNLQLPREKGIAASDGSDNDESADGADDSSIEDNHDHNVRANKNYPKKKCKNLQPIERYREKQALPQKKEDLKKPIKTIDDSKTNQKRLWNRRNACFYCQELVTNFSRHILRRHPNEIEVIKYKSINERDSKLRKLKRQEITDRLRNKGNFVYNAKVRYDKDVKTDLLPNRRCYQSMSNPSSFATCKHCLGSFKKTSFSRHFKKCAPEILSGE